MEVQGPNTVFDDATWVRVDADQVKRLLNVFDTDTNVQTAYKVRMNSVLSGGIRFRRRFHSMSEWNSRLFSSYLVDMVMKVYRLKWAIGFAPVTFIPHPLFGWVPRVIDINDNIDIMMKPFANGTSTQYRYYELTYKVPRPKTPLPTDNPNRVLLKDVITLVESEPAIDGSIRSITTILDRGFHLEEVLFMCCEDAYPRMAVPGIISEKPDEKLDPDNLRNPTDPKASSTIQRTLEQIAKTARSSAGAPDPQPNVNSNAIVFNRLINSRSAFQSEARTSFETQARLERMARARTDMGQQLFLPDGRKLVRQLESRAPDQIMLDYMTLRKRTVCELFSCPYHMLSAEGSKAGASPATIKVFQDAQKALEQQILNDLHLVYTWIYSQGDVASFFRYKADQLKEAKKRNDVKRKRKREQEEEEQKQKEQQQGETQGAEKKQRTDGDDDNDQLEPEDWQMDEKELRLFTEVTIQLPALPDFDVMRQLWLDGLLKPEAFTKYVTALFSFDERDWLSSPALNLKDLRGVKEVDPVVSS